MKRVHLFEFEDQQWFSSFLRNYMTDFLQFLTNKTKLFSPVIPLLENAIEKSEGNQIIDLGSGGDGGLLWLSSELQKNNPTLKITLTDLYPNSTAFAYTQKQDKNFNYLDYPVDARDIPKELKRTENSVFIFAPFYTKDVKKILQNVNDSKENTAIFGGQERSLQV